MSLINDALRRASQTEKDRPRQAAAPIGMEPVFHARSSRVPMILSGVVLIALVLAGWCFWQWWHVRNAPVVKASPENLFPAVNLQVRAPVVQPKPASMAPVVPAVAPVAPVAPPPPVTPASPPVVAPVVAAPPVQPRPPVVDNRPWPVDLKLSAIFFSQSNPRVLINGNIYVTGDDIQGVVIKKIDQSKVTVEWSGRVKTLMMEGQ